MGPKSKLKIYNPQDPGRNPPETPDLVRNMTVRTLPRDPPGEEGPRTKLKIVLRTARNFPERGVGHPSRAAGPVDRLFPGNPATGDVKTPNEREPYWKRGDKSRTPEAGVQAGFELEPRVRGVPDLPPLSIWFPFAGGLGIAKTKHEDWHHSSACFPRIGNQC